MLFIMLMSKRFIVSLYRQKNIPYKEDKNEKHTYIYIYLLLQFKSAGVK